MKEVIRALLWLFGTLVLVSFAKAQGPKLVFKPTPNDALRAALADCRALPHHDRVFTRYLWVSDGDVEGAKALSFALNQLSRAAVIQRPLPFGQQQADLLLVRVDVRHYAPRARDVKEWLRVWEEFQADPAFSLLVTKGTLKSVQGAFPGWKSRGLFAGWRLVDVPPYAGKDGNTHTKRWVRHDEVREVDLGSLTLDEVELVRFPSPALDITAYGELTELTGSDAPVVSDLYFVYRAMSTVKDKGLYAALYGGRYYELAGVPTAGKKGTDEDALFESLGIGNVEQGVTARVVFDKMRSDQRALKRRSGVTGLKRRGDFFPVPSVRLGVGMGLLSITRDLKVQDIDIDTDPFANLIDFTDAAREAIWVRANGLHGYALYDGKGKRQDEAPPDVARDHTEPAPQHGRLQCAISCISCHEAEGSDGWKRFDNDMLTLLRGRGAEVLGDRGVKDQQDALDRLAGLYSGDPEAFLRKSRDDYAAAVLRATGPWKSAKPDQSDVVRLAASKLVERWRHYWHDEVDGRAALLELGLAADNAKDAATFLSALLPPDHLARDAVDGVEYLQEDPRLVRLLRGVPLARAEWDLVRGYAAGRAAREMPKLLKALGK